MINKRSELVALAKKLGVRPDWHEPDEQGVTARLVEGLTFDNAMGDMFCAEQGKPWEHYVVLEQNGRPVALVNLAILFAWATGYESGESMTLAERLNADRIYPDIALTTTDRQVPLGEYSITELGCHAQYPLEDAKIYVQSKDGQEACWNGDCWKESQ